MQSCAGKNQRDGSRLNARQTIAAKAISQGDGVVLLCLGFNLIDGFLKALPHGASTQVVQSLGQEPGVDHVRRPRHGVAELANHHLTTNQEDAHDAAALTSAWMNAGLVPQQPPTKDAPAATSAGRWPAKTSGLIV